MSQKSSHGVGTGMHSVTHHLITSELASGFASIAVASAGITSTCTPQHWHRRKLPHTSVCRTDGPWICAFHEFAALDNAFILACVRSVAPLVPSVPRPHVPLQLFAQCWSKLTLPPGMSRYPFLIYWFLDWWWGSVLIIVFGFFSYYIAWQLSGVCRPGPRPAAQRRARAPLAAMPPSVLACDSVPVVGVRPTYAHGTMRLAAARVRRQASDPAS